MFISCVRQVVQKSFSRNSLNFVVNLQRCPKVRCFSTMKNVNSVEHLERIASNSTVAPVGSTIPVTVPDHVWLSKAKVEEFQSYFPAFVDEMAARAARFSSLDNGKRIRQAMEYIMPGPMRFPGITATESYKVITPKNKLTPQNIKMAYSLGWCLEIFIESINMADDMMDANPTRRHKIAWHEIPEVGQSAVNDAFMIHTGSYFLLRKHFGHLDCYNRLLDIFNDSMFQACVGQHVDVAYAKDINYAKMEIFEEIVANVSTYLAIYFPIAAAMTLAGHTDLEPLKRADKVLKDIGAFFVVQNDIHDCFGEESFTGKKGTDIKEGRWRWPILVAMELASPEQKMILEENMGKDDPRCVTKVTDILRDLNLPKIYEEFTINVCKNLTENLNELDGDIRKICNKLVESVIYARNTGKLIFI